MNAHSPRPDRLRLLQHALEELRHGRIEGAEAALSGLLPDGPALADPGGLEALAREFTAALDWDAAHLAYAILVAAGYQTFEGRLRWMAGRAEHQAEFRTQFEMRPTLDRLGRFLAPSVPGRITAITTERMRPGLVAMALYRHRLSLDGVAEERVLVEKVSFNNPPDLPRVMNEDLLFSAMPAAALMAPEYHGMLRERHFVSSFHAFAEGRPLALESWVGAHAELLYRYWSIPPAKGLSGGPKLAKIHRDVLRRLITQGVPDAVRGHLRAVSPEEVAAVLSRRFDAILETVARLPVFVFHDDLHCGNILVGERGGVTVIDWDGWWLAPLGTGWHFHSTAEEVEAMDLGRIRWARPLPPGIGTRELMLMAALWGWHKALRERKAELAARWLEKILRYA